MCWGTSTLRLYAGAWSIQGPDTVPPMRIVAGTAGGRNLATPEGDDVRPTKDRVREAIFNSLNSYGWVEDCTFLDLFAGSGALGLEALSRGASACTFVDADRRSIAIVRQNVENLGFADRATIRQTDGVALAATIAAHDVALLDPPYDFEAWDELLGIVPVEVAVIESDRAIAPGAGWEILKEKRYAGSVVVIARRESSPGSGRPGGPLSMTRAMYPGSFDPVHVGHVDVVEAVAPLFDDIIVVAMFNPAKPGGFFELEEREALLAATFAHLPNVKTASAPGLVVNAARDLGADVIVKGIRSATDTDIEMQMAQTNKAVSGVQTMFVPAEPANSFVSSRFIREISTMGEDVSAMVPAPVAQALETRKATT